MLGDPAHLTQSFLCITSRMRALLREDNPEISWNAAVDDEFQSLECLSGVIYEPDVENTSLRSESCGSNEFSLEDILWPPHEE